MSKHVFDILAWYSASEKSLNQLADKIFEYREPSLEEYKSSIALMEYLKAQGFAIEEKAAGLDTAFVATWGQKGPAIAFLAEYDALPGMGQNPVETRSEVEGYGHACGHNLLGTGAAAAAAAFKMMLEKSGKEARVILFGCPAEEILRGKIDLIEAGYFKDVDAAIAWHPSTYNTVSEESNQAKVDMEFSFKGNASHAAIAPHKGRSALDACELMNVGVNYLREHVPDDVRMHYVYKEAGVVSNIVPDFARLSYGIRAKDNETLQDALERVKDCAKGAALMTGTSLESVQINHCQDTLVNFALNEAFVKAMSDLPQIAFSQEEKEFAKNLSTNAEGKANKDILREHIVKPEYKVVHCPGSTDVANVSKKVPTVSVFTTCAYNRAPAHNWAFTACCGMSIGQKGMLYASKIMALGAMNLLEEPAILQRAKEEHAKNT